MELLETASAEFERVARMLPPDAWDRPTPADLPVRRLVEHVVTGNRFTTSLLAGTDRTDAAAAVFTGDPLGTDPVAAVVESAHLQAQAFAATPADRVVVSPTGDVNAAAYLRFRLVDQLVHAWDLLRATGLDETLDETAVKGVLAAVEPYLDQMLATGAYGAGPSGTVPTDGDPQRRLLDSFGRRP